MRRDRHLFGGDIAAVEVNVQKRRNIDGGDFAENRNGILAEGKSVVGSLRRLRPRMANAEIT